MDEAVTKVWKSKDNQNGDWYPRIPVVTFWSIRVSQSTDTLEDVQVVPMATVAILVSALVAFSLKKIVYRHKARH